jgi:hypothetical protein
MKFLTVYFFQPFYHFISLKYTDSPRHPLSHTLNTYSLDARDNQIRIYEY